MQRICTEVDCHSVLKVGIAEKYLTDYICAFDESEALVLLNGVDNALILDRGRGVLQPDGPGHQISTAGHGSDLKGDFIAGCHCHVALNVFGGEGQKETFAPVLVADPALGITTGFRIHAGVGSHRTHHAFLSHDDFWSDFGDRTGNRFAGTPIVGHFEFDRIPDFQMFDVSIKLREMEKESGLAVAALDKSVRVQQFLDDSGLAVAGAGWVLIVVEAVVPGRRSRLASIVAVADIEGSNFEGSNAGKIPSVTSSMASISSPVHPTLIVGSRSGTSFIPSSDFHVVETGPLLGWRRPVEPGMKKVFRIVVSTTISG